MTCPPGCAPLPLTAEETACLAEISEALMPLSATILRRAATSDGAGGQTQTWAASSTGVPCSATALGGGASGIGGGERDSEGRWEVAVAYRLAMPPSTDVRASDRVQVSGITLEVTAVVPRWGIGTLKVEAAQVTP